MTTVANTILQDRNNIYMMGSANPVAPLTSVFSGCDIVGFFNGDIPELMGVTITKTSLRGVFTLGRVSKRLMQMDCYMDFHLIGFNETGAKGLISGTCKPLDFTTNMSIDELNIEVCIDFKSNVTRIIGWMDGTAAENQEIGLLYEQLRSRLSNQDR